MNTIKEQLNRDLKNFLQESKWQPQLKDSLSEILEYRPEIPLIMLYEKFILKQKIEASCKITAFINDIAFYSSRLNIEVLDQTDVLQAIIRLAVEKHQIIKIKKSDIVKIISILFIDMPNSLKEAKDGFLKLVTDKMDDSLTPQIFSKYIYVTLFYQKIMQDLNTIVESFEIKTKTKITYLWLQQMLSSEKEFLLNNFPWQELIFKSLNSKDTVNMMAISEKLFEFIHLQFFQGSFLSD